MVNNNLFDTMSYLHKLRDDFAAAAINWLMARMNMTEEDEDRMAELLARSAYKISDAMLFQRDRDNG